MEFHGSYLKKYGMIILLINLQAIKAFLVLANLIFRRYSIAYYDYDIYNKGDLNFFLINSISYLKTSSSLHSAFLLLKYEFQTHLDPMLICVLCYLFFV